MELNGDWLVLRNTRLSFLSAHGHGWAASVFRSGRESLLARTLSVLKLQSQRGRVFQAVCVFQGYLLQVGLVNITMLFVRFCSSFSVWSSKAKPIDLCAWFAPETSSGSFLALLRFRSQTQEQAHRRDGGGWALRSQSLSDTFWQEHLSGNVWTFFLPIQDVRRPNA